MAELSEKCLKAWEGFAPGAWRKYPRFHPI